MSTRIPWTLLSFLIALAVSIAQAQQTGYKAGEYPAPRYPQSPRNPTVEDLMPVARTIVKREGIAADFYPGYGIKGGERVLMMVNRDYDPLVLEALGRAIREAGGKADVLLGSEATQAGGDGVTEWELFYFMNDTFKQATGGIDRPTQVAIAVAGKYNLALSGRGGGKPDYPRDKMRWEYLPWEWADQFLINGANIPPSLLKFLDDTAWDTLAKAGSVHATDPEGTDITWTARPDDWERPGAHNPGHLMSHPAASGATGVVAGTWNHTGPFPQVRVSFKNDRLEGIEGGGAYGQKWRAIRDQWKDTTWSGKQGPGLFVWLQEAAIGTNPKSARPKAALERAKGNIWERTRAGVVHWGIGSGGTRDESLAGGMRRCGADPLCGDSPTSRYFKENPQTPTGHVHVHNFFLTMVLTNRDGSRTPFINKGHLTVLDDPRVRQEAAKYGDPDLLLAEDWIPAIPGINIPGDYRRDYAGDPAAFTQKDLTTNWKY